VHRSSFDGGVVEIGRGPLAHLLLQRILAVLMRQLEILVFGTILETSAKLFNGLAKGKKEEEKKKRQMKKDRTEAQHTFSGVL
jgi:hypothetical protein